MQEIRYRHGFVNWYERNHYFFEWCERNVENKTCRWVDMAGAVDLKKTVNWQSGPGQAALHHARHSARGRSSPTS